MMKRMKKIGSAIAVAAGVVAMGTAAQADTISWATSTDLFQGSTVETFVSTNGTLAAAYNATNLTGAGTTGVNTTVNGVTFVAAEAGTTLVGPTGETITLGGTDPGNNEGAFGDGQFSSNGAIFNLLRGGSFRLDSVTLGNLVAGTTYEIQIFSHDGRTTRGNAATAFGDNNGGISAGADLNNLDTNISAGPSSGGTGDSTIGTFTATGANVTFSVSGDGNITDGGGVPNFTSNNSPSQVNAIQLRAISVAVPEPSALSLLALMGLGVSVRRRK